MKKVYGNATYLLHKLDGTKLKTPIADKRVKLFRQNYKCTYFNEEKNLLSDIEIDNIIN